MLFLIGAVFGMRTRAGDRIFLSRSFGCAVLANALVGVGLPAYCYLKFPAWMWGYYVDPARVPRWLVVAVFAAYWIPFVIGYLAPRRLDLWWRGSAWSAIVGGLLAQGALIAWQWPRYSRIAGYDEYHAGGGVAPADVPLLSCAFPASLVVTAFLWWSARPARPAGAGR